MHDRGLLRVVRREAGIRLYELNEHAPAAPTAAERRRRIDALVDVVVNLYAPLPAVSLADVVRRLAATTAGSAGWYIVAAPRRRT